jgi:hypothetical protein
LEGSLDRDASAAPAASAGVLFSQDTILSRSSAIVIVYEMWPYHSLSAHPSAYSLPRQEGRDCGSKKQFRKPKCQK